jgi:hypothetical protein
MIRQDRVHKKERKGAYRTQLSSELDTLSHIVLVVLGGD